MKIDYTEYSPNQRIAIIAASELVGYKSCFVGIGIPSDAACLAKLSVEPELNLIYESGAIGALPLSKSYSTGSPSIAHGADMITDSLSVFSDLQAGRIDVGLLSAAQIDKFGNLNSTVIGDYDEPKIRMVGSGGAHDIACLIPNLIVLMPHDPRRFVDTVDFATSPGSGRDIKKIRDQLNLPEGPSILITDKAKFIMSDEGWLLHSILDSFTFAQATEGLPWSLKPPISGPIETDPAIISALAQINY